jgi:hypothetical protein
VVILKDKKRGWTSSQGWQPWREWVVSRWIDGAGGLGMRRGVSKTVFEVQRWQGQAAPGSRVTTKGGSKSWSSLQQPISASCGPKVPAWLIT